MSLIDDVFGVELVDIELELRGFSDIEWSDFLLNPRRLRGSDFLMRWAQGNWSEERLIDAINSTTDFRALPYGPSSTAPDDTPRATELYFERLESAGLGEIKRPDLLVFPQQAEPEVQDIVSQLGGVQELPFTPEDDLQPLLDHAFMGIECENSLWKCTQMRNYGEALRPQRRLGGRPGLPKNAVLPNIFIKNEDVDPLLAWQDGSGIPIHVWHVFFERAYGISLTRAVELIQDGLISPTEQMYQAPGGPTSGKKVFKIYYHYAYVVGEAVEAPALQADCLEDASGHILPYVRFTGGSLELDEQATEVLSAAARAREEAT